ncbi:alpha/beta hydrolase [Streptomyces bobili]|uniref:alpha/beta fold hydrolase n=1 Tax=Streptomyces bobili TaxID=67280 RepID=UPI00224D2F7C|nr:alpha/beta hydrolase [Streptomyces bobili]MCX5521846.1 alpha/beta hydrolase [Streptomyces bobili]
MTQVTQRPPFGEDSPARGSQASDRVRHRTGPGAGHFPHVEQPKTVADHILDFLNS